MPEGPEIRRAADRLAKAVVGERLVSAWFAFSALKRFEKSLREAVIESITPHGKALLTRFDNGWTLYSHNQLYGVWRIADAGERPDTKRSLRVALETTRKSILLYSASDVAMWRSDELHAHPFLSRLGPDVLDPGLGEAAVEVRMLDPRFAGRSPGGLLLAQGFLPGMVTYPPPEVPFAPNPLQPRPMREPDSGGGPALVGDVV